MRPDVDRLPELIDGLLVAPRIEHVLPEVHLQTQIEWVHAWGQYVLLTSDEEKLEARGTELFHDAIAKTTTLTGADPALVRQALMGGFASSRILEVHGERMVKRNFEPGFRIELHQKDLNLALEGARALGLSLPNTATAQQLFNSCAAQGGKAWDHSAMVKALELMASHEMTKT